MYRHLFFLVLVGVCIPLSSVGGNFISEHWECSQTFEYYSKRVLPFPAIDVNISKSDTTARCPIFLPQFFGCTAFEPYAQRNGIMETVSPVSSSNSRGITLALSIPFTFAAAYLFSNRNKTDANQSTPNWCVRSRATATAKTMKSHWIHSCNLVECWALEFQYANNGPNTVHRLCVRSYEHCCLAERALVMGSISLFLYARFFDWPTNMLKSRFSTIPSIRIRSIMNYHNW